MGVGLTKDQINNLLLDFINLYLVCMYILNYRNPLLVKSMRKVFWCFPDSLSAAEEWKRLDPLVQKQVRWLQNPRKVDALDGQLYKDFLKHIRAGGRERYHLELAQKQYEFAIAYQKYHECEHGHEHEDGHDHGDRDHDHGGAASSMLKDGRGHDHGEAHEREHDKQQLEAQKMNLNYLLISYVDMKGEQIWSTDNCKATKRELKEQSLYFRLVKQGSQLVYFSFHIFMVFVILMMATLR